MIYTKSITIVSCHSMAMPNAAKVPIMKSWPVYAAWVQIVPSEGAISVNRGIVWICVMMKVINRALIKHLQLGNRLDGLHSTLSHDDLSTK